MHNSISLQAAVELISITIPAINRSRIPIRICHYHGSVIIRSLHLILDNHIIMHLLRKKILPLIAVNTTAGVGYREPQIAPFDSALKIGVGYMLSACNIINHWCNEACAGVADVRNFCKKYCG